MNRHWGRRGLAGAFLALALAATACGGGGGSNPAGAGKEQLNLTMGGSQSGSSVFSLITAQARLAGNADGALDINIRETAASSENIQLLRDGAVDFGLSGLGTVIGGVVATTQGYPIAVSIAVFGAALVCVAAFFLRDRAGREITAED